MLLRLTAPRSIQRLDCVASREMNISDTLTQQKSRENYTGANLLACTNSQHPLQSLPSGLIAHVLFSRVEV